MAQNRFAGNRLGRSGVQPAQSTSVNGGTRRWRLPVTVMRSVQPGKDVLFGAAWCILCPCQGQNGNPGSTDKHTEELEQYRLATEGAADALWYTDIRTGKTWISDRYQEIVGDSSDESATHQPGWIGRVHADDQAEVEHKFEEYLLNLKRDFESEYRTMHRDGTT